MRQNRIHIEINETVFQYKKSLLDFLESQRDKEMQAFTSNTYVQYLNALKSKYICVQGKFIEKNEALIIFNLFKHHY